jgi:DNA-binding GntR family transcriptional regulator
MKPLTHTAEANVVTRLRYTIVLMTPEESSSSVLSEPNRLRTVAGSDSAVERVTAEIRRGVLNGTLAAGSTFSISELSTQLGVSHIPVREALRRLEAQGLITLRPGRSAMVSPLDRDELRAIYRLRQDIEPGVAARACPMLSADDLAEAEQLLSKYVHGDQDPDVLWDVHRQFHVALMRPAMTAWDFRILDQLWHASDRYTRILFETYDVDEDERRRREVAHRNIIDAARSKSALETKHAVSEHLAENELACLEWMAALNTNRT